MIISVPAAGSQLSVNVVVATGSPAALSDVEPRPRRTVGPRLLGQHSLTAVMLVIEKIAMITRYGA